MPYAAIARTVMAASGASVRARGPSLEHSLKTTVNLHGKFDLPLESSFGHLVRSIYRMQAALLQARLAEDGVSFGCWYFLRVLWTEDLITQRELSSRTGVNEATTRTAVDRMEKEKLVTRRTDATDRRKRFIRLTPRARELEPSLIAFADELNNRMLEPLQATERAAFLRQLHDVHDHVRQLASRVGDESGVDQV